VIERYRLSIDLFLHVTFKTGQVKYRLYRHIWLQSKSGHSN